MDKDDVKAESAVQQRRPLNDVTVKGSEDAFAHTNGPPSPPCLRPCSLCAPTSYFLHFPSKTAFVRTFPCTFCSARFSWLVENCATYVDPRCQAASLLDVTAWQSFHSWMCKLYMDVTTRQSTWMSPHGKVSTPPLQLPSATCNTKAS